MMSSGWGVTAALARTDVPKAALSRSFKFGRQRELVDREVRVTTFQSGREPFRPRVEVEVRSRFDGRWVSGFEIADINDDRYMLRRRSDGAMLPVDFPARDIRSRPRD
jgi:hypothetical protein